MEFVKIVRQNYVSWKHENKTFSLIKDLRQDSDQGDSLPAHDTSCTKGRLFYSARPWHPPPPKARKKEYPPPKESMKIEAKAT